MFTTFIHSAALYYFRLYRFYDIFEKGAKVPGQPRRERHYSKFNLRLFVRERVQKPYYIYGKKRFVIRITIEWNINFFRFSAWWTKAFRVCGNEGAGVIGLLSRWPFSLSSLRFLLWGSLPGKSLSRPDFGLLKIHYFTSLFAVCQKPTLIACQLLS